MSRYFLELAYRGAGFAGFQVQKNAVTIQGEINRSLGILLKKEVHTTCSSRTDSGVHARQNFVHFDISPELPSRFLYSLNAILGPRILVRAAYLVPDRAHARFDAISRTYQYFLCISKDPFLQDFGYYFPFPLDLSSMQAVSSLILGKLDFRAFSKRSSLNMGSVCDIREAGWTNSGGNTLVFRVNADRFLRGMVRALVGSIVKVGTGRLSPGEFKQILEGQGQHRADFSVPGKGLFLESVEFPEGLLVNRLSGADPF